MTGELLDYRRDLDNTGLAQRCVVWFTPFQDDITVLSIGPKEMAGVEESMELIVRGELGISISTKAVASRPFAADLESLGAQFFLDEPRDIHCVPAALILARFKNAVTRLRADPYTPRSFDELER